VITSGLARTQNGQRQAWMRRKGCLDNGSSRAAVAAWTMSGVETNYAAIAIAVAGLITTALAPVVQGRTIAKNEVHKWRREAAADAYTDALASAEVAEQLAEWTRDPFFTSYSRRPEVKHSV
jgi:hypothetical protein